MEFNWVRALAVTACLVLPCSIMGAILSFFEDHYIACGFFALMLFVTIFILAGVQEEMITYEI